MAFSSFPLAIQLFINFGVCFPSPHFSFVGVLVGLGHIALLWFFILVFCEVSICSMFCGQRCIVM